MRLSGRRSAPEVRVDPGLNRSGGFHIDTLRSAIS